MKKNTFMEGTFIATISLIFIKVIGMLYVIPFYALVGKQGAALYAYGYSIYSLFLDISTAGIPNAVSKLINEFNTLDKQEAKVRTFKLGKQILGFIAVTSFVVMFLFAPQIANIIIGDMAGGNTPEDITFVIRCVSFAILVFPFLSVSRGFFQGHNIIYVSSVSQVIEQVVRVGFILGGSYIALKVLGLSLTHVVGVAVFSAFVGGAFSFLYVYSKLRRNKKELFLDKEFKVKDQVTNKEIIKSILKYAVPVVIVSVAFSIYNNVDMILILRTMNHLGYEAHNVEFIATGISTWVVKISIIITAIGFGLSSSLIPAIVESFTLKKYDDVNDKFNKAMEIIILVSVPMCFGISLLSKPIWTIFYGYSEIGSNLLLVCIFAPLFSNLYTIANYTLQSINKFKMVYVTAILGLLINISLDVPLMLLFNAIHLPAYWGATMATVIGLGTAVIIAMKALKKEFHFKYQEILKVIKKTMIPLIAMILVVLGLKILLPVNYHSRFSCIINVAVISLIGGCMYLFIAYKMGLMQDVLGDDFLNKIKRKFFKNKKGSS